jgi:molybdenum cofactor cytidylyltransferase
MRNIAVLVLAAGKSSRMKSIKQLEKIDNKTLLDITLEKAKQLFSKAVFCVLGANSEIIKKNITTQDITFINNKNFETGLSSSIVAGLHHFKKEQLNFDGILILLADQPAIGVSYLRDMLHLSELNTDKIIASKYDAIFGVPAIFPKNSFQELENLKGDKGAKEFLNDATNRVISPKEKTNLLDIDTKEQLKLFINS